MLVEVVPALSGHLIAAGAIVAGAIAAGAQVLGEPLQIGEHQALCRQLVEALDTVTRKSSSLR